MVFDVRHGEMGGLLKRVTSRAKGHFETKDSEL